MKDIFLFSFFILSGIIGVHAQEICDNGIDDDGDGRIDCVDLDCDCNNCSEKQTDIWYFGHNSGLDFSTGSPQSITGGQVNTGEGCATMSDANGNLLFYTDGRTVWNRNHVVMTNGGGLMGHPSSTQSAVTVPHPTDPALYYVFTVDYSGGSRGLRYSIVDLSLSGGLGSITTKNILLMSNTTEKIGVVRHCNNRDFWILGHEYNSNRFFVYELTTTGLNTTPNIQSIGMSHNGGTANKLGYMKPSPDGTKLACAIFFLNTVNLFDFDNFTGLLSNPLNITTSLLQGAYGIEFSRDAQILYATALEPVGKLLQFDLSSNNAATITASAFTLAQYTARYEYGALQMASNGIIYVARRNVTNNPVRTHLSSVNNPSVLGVGANFQDVTISLLPGGSGLSLPTFVQGYDYATTVKIDSITTSGLDTLCITTGLSTFGLKGNYESCALDTILWQHKGVNLFDSSTDTSITLNISNVGHDTIIAEVKTFCKSTFDTLIVPTIVCPVILLNTELLSYKVEKQNDKAFIYWEAPVPNDYTRADIERSADASRFEKITSSLVLSSNAYLDGMPLNGDNYYRLKLYKIDGSYDYTLVKHLKFKEEKATLTTIPNPFLNNFTVKINSNREDKIEVVQLSNLLGQVVYYKETEKISMHQLPISNLPSGAYWVSVKVGEKWIKKKVIKQ
jgi:hypothetical protein